MTILAMVFDFGSDEDVAFERRQLLEAHASSYGFQIEDNVETVFGTRSSDLCGHVWIYC